MATGLKKGSTPSKLSRLTLKYSYVCTSVASQNVKQIVMVRASYKELGSWMSQSAAIQ